MRRCESGEEFQGRVVVVTGAAGHIGAACANRFRMFGATVAAIDKSPPPVNESDAGVYVSADVSSAGEVNRAFDEIESRLGSVEIIVQCAAVLTRCAFLETTPETLYETMAVNVCGSFLVAQRAAARMIEKGIRGTIINFGSIAAVLAEPDTTAYDSSKGAVLAATRSMAVALSPHGIRVNCVAPGIMMKAQGEELRDEFDVTAYERKRIPLARLGNPEDIADVVIFLASGRTTYMTGTTVWVDGGSLAAW